MEQREIKAVRGTIDNGRDGWAVSVDGSLLSFEGPYGHKRIRKFRTEEAALRAGRRFVARNEVQFEKIQGQAGLYRSTLGHVIRKIEDSPGYPGVTWFIFQPGQRHPDDACESLADAKWTIRQAATENLV